MLLELDGVSKRAEEPFWDIFEKPCCKRSSVHTERTDQALCVRRSALDAVIFHYNEILGQKKDCYKQ